MLHKKYFWLILFAPLLVQIMSCKKYLDKKPLQSLTVPSTLTDLQALLDNEIVTQRGGNPGLLELVADNYYVSSSDWQGQLDFVGPDEPLNYIWDKNATHIDSWRLPYEGPIYYSNIVLDVLPNIPVNETNKDSWNNIKGYALFYRAFTFLELAQIYCRPYSSSATTDLGIVLKLNSNVNEPSVRSTVQQTYDQIVNDLKEAVDLLPTTTLFSTRPNKAAAYGALARTYLYMRDYVNAGKYADLCLQMSSTLLDYNTLIPVKSPPVPIFTSNPEIIFFTSTGTPSLLGNRVTRIDSTLYNSYNSNDLRKVIFFKANTGSARAGTYNFNASYLGTGGPTWLPMDGITTAEMYLTRAECFARAGNKDAALADLNALMIKRWSGSFTPITATDATDAKNKILVERRKELVYRGIRWSDLRRLNLEGANITLTRIINGVTYTLPPNDLRWVMLIPPIAINLSNLQQNPR